MVLFFAAGEVSLVVHFLWSVRLRFSNQDRHRGHDLLFAFALGNDAFNLVQSTVCTRRTMLYYIAADLARATALAGFRCSSLDAFGRPVAIRLEAGIGGSAFRGLGMYMDGVRGRRGGRVREVAIH